MNIPCSKCHTSPLRPTIQLAPRIKIIPLVYFSFYLPQVSYLITFGSLILDIPVVFTSHFVFIPGQKHNTDHHQI